jgi:LuxR family quorum sensing-dependent transcriptional regulator
VSLEETIAAIEGCQSLDELGAALQRIVEDYGFAAFDFIDVGQPHLDLPFHSGTSGKKWEEEYISNKFFQVDPCIARVRRSNVPFIWGDIRLDEHHAGRKPGALKTFEAAWDHGFTEGLVVPCHFSDDIGRRYSSSVAFFWKDPVQRFRFLLTQKKHELHILTIYWVQRAVDLISSEHRGSGPILRTDANVNGGIALTDREREVLSWAARGKTTSETAEILTISDETVEGHIRNAMRKLTAANKTQAVVKAIYLGFVDV